MLSPWLILAAVLAIASAGVGGYFKGSADAENKAKAEYAKQLDGVIAEHNQNAVIDMQAAAEVAAKEAQAKTKTVYIRGAASEAIAKSALPADCLLIPAQRYSVLLAAVKAANGDSQDAPAGLLDAIRKAGEPAKQQP